MPRTFLATAALTLPLAFLTGAAPDGPLPRRGFFGTMIEPVGPQGGPGVRVREAIPGSTAEELGLKAGDVVTEVGGQPVPNVPGFVGMIGGLKEGAPIAVAFTRDGEPRTVSGKLKARPRETLEGAEVVHGEVATKTGRMRTILTRPEGGPDEKRPALFVIQGLGGFSVENAGRAPGPYAEFVRAFSDRGYVTFRVEKPGQGDSEGGPTRDADFEAELDAYRQGLKALKASPFVDPDRVVVFGHSMGGVMGPLIAADDPVKGIAVYGTLLKTWNEYLLENTRRQLALSGEGPAAIDDVLRKDAAIQYLLFFDGKSPEEVARERPELAARLDQTISEGKYAFGRHVAFFRQLAATNLPAAWEKFDGHALAAWGESDFVSTGADHATIAELVNRRNPGKGTFRALKGLDHGFHAAATPEASFTDSAGPEPRPFDPAFLDALLAWSDRLVGR